MIDITKIPDIFYRIVTVVGGDLPPYDGPVLWQPRSGGDWEFETCILASYDNVLRYRPIALDGHTSVLVERTKYLRAWERAPACDESSIRVLWSDGEVSVDQGDRCQTPWQNTHDSDDTYEIGWTTEADWFAFLQRSWIQ
jgi:hypothetical protein